MMASTPDARAIGLGVITAIGVSCSSELNAPDCYNPDGPTRCNITGAAFDTDQLPPTTGDTQGGSIAIDCSAAPNAALLANYRFTPVVSGAQGDLQWLASELPPGITQDPVTGTLEGIPTQTGPAEIPVYVQDGFGNFGSTVCSFTVYPALAFDMEGLLAQRPGCIGVGGSLLERIVPQTGDGTRIVCDTPTGLGNGHLPTTVSVDPNQCTLSGAVDNPGIGTWVFMVRARQSGRELFVPYCVTDTTAEPDAYDITVDHSGIDPSENPTLTPLVQRYAPGSDFAVGGNGDPLFRVVDPDVCGPGCAYQYTYEVSSSLFDGQLLSFQPETTVSDDRGAIGFSHNLLAYGPPAGTPADLLSAYATRPWILSLSTHYCLAGAGDTCTNPDGSFAPGGHLEFSVIMMASP